MSPAAQDEWVAASNSKLLGRLGAHCNRKMAERGLQAIRERKLFEARLHGIPEKQALRSVDAIITMGENRWHQPVWNIRASQVGLLADWLAEEKGWIGAGSYRRLRNHGIHENIEGVVADMHQALMGRYDPKETSEELALYLVEKKGFRKHPTGAVKSEWQFHERVLPELKEELARRAELRKHPEWITSHDHAVRALGASDWPALDPALAAYHDRLIQHRIRKCGQTAAAATQAVEEILRPAVTRKKVPCWEIRRAHLTDVLKAVGARIEKDWASEESLRWRARGIGSSPHTIGYAMEVLRKREVERLVGEGKTPQEAADIVATTLVKEGSGRLGKPVLKAHLEQAPALHGIIESLPDHATHLARGAAAKATKEARKSADRG